MNIVTKRGILALGASVAVALSLAACTTTTDGGTPSTSSGPVSGLANCAAWANSKVTGQADAQQAASTEKVELHFTWWGDDTRAQLTQNAIDAFEALYPNITIVGEPGVMDGYFDKLATRFAGGTSPDVMTLGGSYPLDYAANGSIINMCDAANNMDLAPFGENILANSKYKGGIYGVPTGGNTLTMLANPAVFQAAGVALPDDDTWTWEQFVTIAGQITAGTPDGTYGAEMNINSLMGSYVAQRGDSVYSDDGTTVTMPASDLTDYWNMELALQANSGMPTPEIHQETVGVSPELSLMGQGKSGMIASYDNQLQAYATAAGGDLKMLRLPGESEYAQAGATMNPSQYFAISSQSKHPVEAQIFVNWMVNSLTAGPILGTSRGMPINTDVRDAIQGTFTPLQQQQSDYMTRVLAHATGTYNPQPAGASIAQDLNKELDSKVLFKTETPDQAAQEWITRMQASLDQSQ
ncbi:MAG: extracellular solute-binding protein [Propionibacteriaceae bacterium]|nr:extracellular solute-binding protein [Propionibacteriaceae bacterium]